jgi:hypothetical protein
MSLAGPRLGPRQSEVEPLGDTDQQPRQTVFLWPQLPDSSTDGHRSSFAFLIRGGSSGFLALSDLTDVGLSSALPLAFASSVIPRLCLRTRLAVRSARLAPGRGPQRFHVLQRSPDDLGPPFATAVPTFTSEEGGTSGPDCLPFGSSLTVSLACLTFTMLAGVQLT